MLAAKSNPVEAMPSLAAIPAVKPDKNAGLDVPESFKSVVTVVEKKCRNLEKRKVTKVLFRCLPTRVRSFPRQHEVVMPAFLNLGFKLQKFDFHLFSSFFITFRRLLKI